MKQFTYYLIELDNMFVFFADDTYFLGAAEFTNPELFTSAADAEKIITRYYWLAGAKVKRVTLTVEDIPEGEN